MHMTEYCVKCLSDKHLNNAPAWASAADVERYREKVRAIIADNMHLSAPETTELLERAYIEAFEPLFDYAPVKHRFNALMLAHEADMMRTVDASEDPLKRAVQFAMVGNFIDFAVLRDVDEGKLHEMLEASCDIPVDENVLDRLREDVLNAEHLVFFTDNCGEIVPDKVLMRTLKKLNPHLELTAIVRGLPVVNDATLDDAAQTDLASVVTRVIGNGCGVAGTVLPRVSDEARRAIDAADVLIAKGQGNYETLGGCGLNVYYIFMCKCRLFMEKFNVPQFSGMLVRER